MSMRTSHGLVRALSDGFVKESQYRYISGTQAPLALPSAQLCAIILKIIN